MLNYRNHSLNCAIDIDDDRVLRQLKSVSREGEEAMRKLMALMRIRKDISFTEARRMYEEEHVQLVMQLMPMIKDYRRSYLSVSSAYIPGTEVFPDFDVVIELWFDSERELDEVLSQSLNGEQGLRLREDSSRFLDRDPLACLQLMRRSRYVSLTKPKGSSCIAAIPPAQYIFHNCGLESLTESNHDRR
jgi:hypothetical protein